MEADQDQSERAYQAIRRDIATGLLEPGQPLVEADIGQRAGVSRTPVRQALRRLEREGVVHIEKRRSARLRSVSAEQMSDLYEFRAHLEAFNCRLAARRADDEDRAELRRLADDYEVAVREDSSEDLARVRKLNEALHRRIAAAAHNPYVSIALDTAIENPLMLRAQRRPNAKALGQSAFFHQLIVRAVCDGEEERAARLVIEHVLQARDRLVANYELARETARSCP